MTGTLNTPIRCLREPDREPYRPPPRPDTLLAPHATYLTERAPRLRLIATLHDPVVIRKLLSRTWGWPAQGRAPAPPAPGAAAP